MADFLALVLLVLGLGTAANGVYMLVPPPHWYDNVPTRSSDLGPMNIHLVGDVGCVYVASGLGLIWAMRARKEGSGEVAHCAALSASAFHFLHALSELLF